MSFTLDWIIDSATAGTILCAGGLLVLAFVRGSGLKQRWGEAIMAACMMAALITLLPGRPQLSLSLIHLGDYPAAKADQSGQRLHIGPLVGVVTGVRRTGHEVKNNADHGKQALPASLEHRLKNGVEANGLWWLPIIYLCGMVFMLARLAIGQWILWRLHTAARPASVSAQRQWHNLLGGWPNSRWSRPPRLLVATDLRSPLTFGIWRPIVLIPPSLCEPIRAMELQAVLLHELAHIRRRDTLADAVAVLAGVFFFYQPLLWWLRRKVRLYREYVADQQAAMGMASPGRYATCLLELARNGGPLLEWPGPAAPLLRSHSEFYQRMKQLLHYPAPVTSESPTQAKWLLSTAVTLAMATTCLTLRAGAGIPLWPRRDVAVMTDLRANATSTSHWRQRSTFNPAVAVNLGTTYLLRSQGDRGQWLGRYGPAVTALVVKALVASGHSWTARPVRTALTYIESCRHADGGFYTSAEPAYNTAIVIRTLASLPSHRFARQVARGLHFLKAAEATAATAPNQTEARWLYPDGLHSALDAEPTMEALRGAGRSAADTTMRRSLAMLRRDSSWINHILDPQERSADAILYNYGRLTYAQLKSMIYAGLSRNDPRVRRMVRWIRGHYTLKVNPASNSSRGRYYYYLTFAKVLRTHGSPTITDVMGVQHHWQRELYRRLAATQMANGSWVNHHSSAYLEGNPMMATTYAVLTLEQLEKPLP